ncbi:ABC transporter substrate-binding protein [Lichenibacterium dinghuense]|uniref:ABC transporter substrate-binding protein n=1 Tax=Lichenibacterium dinghuense TaxID=2895977 RepID=UPI001F2D4B80|nr:ABC transporter substrate-binding protein [Lichenibacterium sp. 6Y81]
MTTRRQILKGGLAAGAVVAMPAVLRAQAEPFRIGLLTVRTGPLAQGGLQMEQGLATFLKEKGSTLAGRAVELIAADTGGNPAGARTKAQELVERNKVGVILGPLAAFELLAVTDYVRARKVPLISLAAAEDVTQRHVNPWVVRPAASSGQCSHVMADYALKEMHLKRVATISEDFAFGYEQVSAFQRVFEDEGGKVVRKLWPPLNAPDFTPFIAQIGQVDGVFTGFAGSNPLKFLRAYADVGLKGKVPVTGGWTAFDDALLKSFGDEAVGAYSSTFYTSDYGSDSNKRFVAAMDKDYGVVPGAYSAGMYIAGQCVEGAIAKLGGKTDDKDAFMAALKGLSLTDTPRGPFTFDTYGNVVGDVFVRRCERQGGKLVNATVKTYEKVSQFWTYDPATFLKEPVYAKDSPPAKNLE